MTVGDCCASDAPKANGGYDLAVIGAGSAGFSAAIAAAELGANVALVGHGMIGGTCADVGHADQPHRFAANQVLRWTRPTRCSIRHSRTAWRHP